MARLVGPPGRLLEGIGDGSPRGMAAASGSNARSNRIRLTSCPAHHSDSAPSIFLRKLEGAEFYSGMYKIRWQLLHVMISLPRIKVLSIWGVTLM